MFFTRREQAAIGVCLATLLACAGAWAWRARAMVPERKPDSPFLATPEAAAVQAATPLTVHVAGLVKRPGVYQFKAGQRVHEAIQHAGGSLPGADLDELNLAATLIDGERVYVPAVPEAPPLPGTVSASRPGGAPSPDWLKRHPININTAAIEQLELLPGVGPVTAQKIVEDRRANGPFRTVNQLTRVQGIGDKTLAALRSFIRV